MRITLIGFLIKKYVTFRTPACSVHNRVSALRPARKVGAREPTADYSDFRRAPAPAASPLMKRGDLIRRSGATRQAATGREAYRTLRLVGVNELRNAVARNRARQQADVGHE
jgi:hypothetical protein